MSRLLVLLLVLGAAGPAFGQVIRQPLANTARKTLKVGQLERSYLLHVPPKLPAKKPAPLVLVFHGGSGNAVGLERFTRFSALADREGFLVAYPDGVGNNWNDGREAPGIKAQRDKVDDVRFISQMIDAVGKVHPVDPKRIFATGISNGGIFSHYLGANLSTRIAAIAPVVGGLADPFHKKFKPEKPVSVFIIQGTKDPLVPYDGGNVTRTGRRGKVIATDEAVKLWVRHDGCDARPVTGTLPDRDPADGCTVKWSTWRHGRDGTEVTLYRIEGGGHTWPGGPQYARRAAVGPVCRDFDATEAIWDFFKKHPRR